MINIYYDVILPSGPLGNGAPHVGQSEKQRISSIVTPPAFPRILRRLDIPFRVRPISEFTREPDGEKHLFLIEIENHDLAFFYQNVIYHLSEQAKEAIRQGLRLAVLTYTEGHDLDCPRYLPLLYLALVDFRLPVEKIHLVHGDLNFVHNHQRSQRYGSSSLVPHGFSFWEFAYWEQMQSRWWNESVRRNEEVELKPDGKSKQFLCLNGNARPHRLALVSELKRRQLDQYGHWSLVGRSYRDVFGIDVSQFSVPDHPDNDQILMALEEFGANWQPVLLDISLDELWQDDRAQQRWLYEETYFSLVTETNVDPHILFITEKTFKPIWNRHPFIIYGNPGLLEYLRRRGYQTFPELFDESYDLEPHRGRRLHMVLDQVERLCRMSSEDLATLVQSIWWKLEANRDLLMRRNYRDEFIDLIDAITPNSLSK